MKEINEEKLVRHVAARLRKMRGDLSQTEFAQRIGATQAQVSDWEAAKYMPSMPVMIRICQRTGTDLAEFVPALKKRRGAA